MFGDTVTAGFGTLSSKVSPTVRNLGVIFNCHLRFDKQIGNVARSSFFQLRLLAKVKLFLSRQDLEKAIHALISSRLDYCNALYVGVSQSALSRLQLVQNAASRLLTNRREHMTPTELLLEVPRSRYKYWGDRASAVAAPRLWNKLPTEMCVISGPLQIEIKNVFI